MNYTITVIAKQQRDKVHFAPGPTLRDILNTSELRTRSACRGNGACGLCRVRLVSGSLSTPSQMEEIHIEAADLAAGVRLACQLRPDCDMTVELLNPATPSNWRSLPDQGHRPAFPLRIHDRNAGRYGVAVDLGTTHISIALSDLISGELLASRYGANPQGRYSSDILNRLQAASEEEANALELQQLVVEAIGDALMDISVREGRSLYDISRVEVVGNSAMLTLLAGDNYRQLLDPATWTRPVSCKITNSEFCYESWNLDRSAQIDLVQPLAGFVGSDLAAGLVHSQLLRGAGPGLFIDFGTNSEIALWDGSQLLVTSAAGGPAFEGMGIA
ncbi:MAG: ASKHA domain-containing protein, partial [Chromatiales bacterium]